MSKYLRKFETEAAYSAATIYTPSVSLIAENMSVKFDPYIPPTPATFSGLTVYYNISDTSEPTKLFVGGGSGSGSGSGSGGVLPSAMIIDGNEVEVTNSYQFSTTGEHIVQYSFEANEIPENFFYGDYFPYVTEVEIGNSFTSIGVQAFYNLDGMTTCTIGSGVTNIGLSAFANCSSLTSCTIGSGVTNIDGTAFGDCSGLTSIEIPDSVTSIGNGAFHSCTSLTSINIPNHIISIGNNAFKDCSGFTSITVNATTPPTLGNNAFYNTNDCPIYVPAASRSDYAREWDAYTERIQAIP